MSAEVKSGYKQTELGIIPEDWDVKHLGQLIHSVDYGSSAKSSSSGKIPVLRMGNLQEGKIDWSDLVFTDNDSEIAKYLLNPGDVLFNRTNTVDLVGKTAIYKGEQPSIFAGYLIRIKEKKDRIDSRYLNYFLNSEPAKSYGLKVLSIAVGQANINGQKLKTYPTPLPPTVDEQNSIATAISEMEELISSLDELIAKKRDIQQASMQQLLTGQTRLSGFSGDWIPTTLGEVATFLSGGTPSRSNDAYWNGEIPWISATSLRCSEIWRSDSNVTEEAVAAGSKIAPIESTLLLVRGSALHKEILCGLVTNRVCFNQDVKALVPHSKLFPRFLTTLIRGRAGDFLKLVSSAGNTAGVLDTKLLKAFEFLLPGLPEQTAIANVLTDMDAELAALEARRDKARQLRQGMIQELLTGRIRLV